MKNELTKTDEGRRKFLIKLSVGLSALAAAIISVPVLGALLAPLLEKSSPVWRSVGMINDFAVGSTSLVTFTNADPQAWAGITAKSAAWLRRNDEKNFIAFSINCTHLGCPVRWEEGAQLFMCPCHGGVYYKDGSRASGPPRSGLTKYDVRIVKNQVQIKTAPIPIASFGA